MRCLLAAMFWIEALLPAQGQPEPDFAQDLVALRSWLGGYRKGAFRLVKNGALDPQAIAEVRRLFARLGRWNDLPAAKALFDAARVAPELPGAQTSTDSVTFAAELMPWRVRSLARAQIAAMQCAEIEPWLTGLLPRSGQGHPISAETRAAAMRILAARGQAAGLKALLRATRTLDAEGRVHAVHALGRAASPKTAAQLLGLLRDVEPNVRIATLNALGKALGPATDETLHGEVGGEIAKLRDRVIGAMKALLLRDRIWQVRAAAAENLVALRCRQVIPALIAGLEAELHRKQDPWAMDMRLHRLLEGMTGLKVLPGSAEPFKRFWRREGSRFRLARASTRKSKKPRSDRYQHFFSIDIESDRVLFVLDFSGSMREPVTLQGTTTGAGPGQKTTKAQLVIEELKKIVMGLPDGTIFNVVVFSEEVRVWRAGSKGRPALVKLDDEARDDLLGSYLDGLQPAGATNLYGALAKVFDFAGRGLYDKYYGLAFDTVYVLSDGAPTWGEVTDREEILRRVEKANALRRLTIHTVTFGDKNETRFLGTLAKQNGGRHIHIQ